MKRRGASRDEPTPTPAAPGGTAPVVWLDYCRDRAALQWFYEQNLAIANIFFDWRHKLLSLGIGSASALVALSLALHESRNKLVAAMPAALGFAIALAVVVVNERFATILRATYVHGHVMEKAIVKHLWPQDVEHSAGPFQVLALGHPLKVSPIEKLGRVQRVSFTKVIRALGMVICAVCCVTFWATLRSV